MERILSPDEIPPELKEVIDPEILRLLDALRCSNDRSQHDLVSYWANEIPLQLKFSWWRIEEPPTTTIGRIKKFQRALTNLSSSAVASLDASAPRPGETEYEVAVYFDQIVFEAIRRASKSADLHAADKRTLDILICAFDNRLSGDPHRKSPHWLDDADKEQQQWMEAERAPLSARLMGAIWHALVRAQADKRRGRTRGASNWLSALADHLVCAYYDIAGELPPTSDPGAILNPQHPYHRLVCGVFRTDFVEGVFGGGMPSWSSHASQAAKRLRRKLRSNRG